MLWSRTGEMQLKGAFFEREDRLRLFTRSVYTLAVELYQNVDRRSVAP